MIFHTNKSEKFIDFRTDFHQQDQFSFKVLKKIFMDTHRINQIASWGRLEKRFIQPAC